MRTEAITLNKLEQTFQQNGDVKFQQFTFQQETVCIITCEGMVDEALLYELILPEVKKALEDRTAEHRSAEDIEKAQRELEASLALPQLKEIKKVEDCERLLFTGQCLLYFINYRMLLVADIAKKPNRKPEDTNLEAAVKGPRDNFIEDISINIALIRKRLPTNSLIVDKMELGKRSKTDVALLYFEDIVDKEILKEAKMKLGKAKGDIILSGEVLLEDVSKDFFLFPRTEYTGRPDFVVQALVRGRFALLVDGTAYATLFPTNFFLLLKSAEDNEYPVVYSSFQRILRIIGLLLALLLPSFWLALTTFHQDQIPVQLLATVVQANTGLPLPSALEMLIMIFFFELFREAGMRLPTVIGGTISVVGGLIIGDAAIRAGITSPAMVVVIAISTIAGFTLVNQSLVGSVTLLRILFVILTSFVGLFGFFACIYFTIAYLSHLKVFGVPYLNVAADMSFSSILKTMLRLKGDGYEKRPKMLKPKDDTRREKK